MDYDELLKIIACPKCHADLELVEQGFLCQKCQVVYPIENEIPILLIDKSVPLNIWNQKEHK